MLKFLIYALTVFAAFATDIHNKTLLRIINGIPCYNLDVSLDYVVSLSSNQLNHFCGGSLIKPNYVLTAAHCAVKHKWIYVILLKDSSNRRTILVKERYVHPVYKKQKVIEYDIAVLKMIAPAPSWLNLHYAKLGGPMPDEVKQYCPVIMIVGWGYIDNYETKPKSLMCVAVPVIEVKFCAETYYSKHIGELNWVCTFSKDGRDGCHADSGSPVICPDTDEVIGVHSIGVSCGDGESPAASVRVDRFRDFINEVISRSAAIPATTPTTLTYKTGVVIIWMKWTLY